MSTHQKWCWNLKMTTFFRKNVVGLEYSKTVSQKSFLNLDNFFVYWVVSSDFAHTINLFAPLSLRLLTPSLIVLPSSLCHHWSHCYPHDDILLSYIWYTSTSIPFNLFSMVTLYIACVFRHLNCLCEEVGRFVMHWCMIAEDLRYCRLVLGYF